MYRVFADQGIQKILKPVGLPIQSIPFNIVALSMLLLMKMKLHGFGYESEGFQDIKNNTFANTNQYLTTDWNQVQYIGRFIQTLFLNSIFFRSCWEQ